MRSPFTRMVKSSVRAGQNVVSQVVVSVAAAVCVGFITNAYFEQTPASPEPAAVQATEQAVESANASIRIIGGTTNTSVASGQPPRPLQPIAEPPVRDVAEAAQVAPAAEAVPVNLPPLASEIIVDLPVRDVTYAPEDAEIFPGVPAALAEHLRTWAPVAEQPPDRRHFLGLPLPYFVPTAGDIMQSASAAGGKIVALVDR